MSEVSALGKTHESDSSQSIVAMFVEQLKLSKVGPGQRVAILKEGDIFEDRARGFEIAIRQLGAEPVVVDVGKGRPSSRDGNQRLAELGVTGLRGNKEAMEILTKVDMIIDLVIMLGSPEQMEIERAGVRILLVVEPTETLRRLFPNPGIRVRAEAGAERLKRAQVMHITNRAGTDVTYEINSDLVFSNCGFSDRPGQWDHWPSGMVVTIARNHRVNGTVVLDTGDILYPLMKQVGDPIRMEIADGMITDISGGADADALSAYMASYNDSRAYAISHIGWGLNENCEWSVERAGIGMDGRAYYGGVLFSTGPDLEFGGTNDTMCHLDIPMRNCTLELDGETIIRDGEMVPKELQVIAA